MDLRTRVLVETRSTLSVVSLASLVAHFIGAAGTVTVTSGILNPVAASPQLVSPSVYSCVSHCPERVTVVVAVFVPLSPVRLHEFGFCSGIVLFDLVMLSFTSRLCNCPLAVLIEPLALWRCYPHAAQPWRCYPHAP